MSRRPFQPTDEQRKQVEQMSAVGITHEQQASLFSIDADTLKKYFKKELAEGALKANKNVASSLYQSAINGNVTAQIFWCKARLGWKETDRIEHAGRDGSDLVPTVNINLKR